MTDRPDPLPRQIAVCRTMEEIRDAIAAYCFEQSVSRRELDHRAGLADGHSSKLLSPKAARQFGSTSLRWVLAALDLEIVLRERDAPLSQTEPRARIAARMPARYDWRRKRGPGWGRRMAALRHLGMTATQRSASARKAAQARWQCRQTALTNDAADR